ncbi:MAG: sensor histidine kinase [Phycisphaeraceae bacterium]
MASPFGGGKPRIGLRPALRVALVYGVLSAVWVLTSDLLMTGVPWFQNHLQAVSIIKGWGFIGFTAVLLYLMVDRYIATIARRAEALRQSEEDARRLAETRRVLLRELDHRVKNNLANLYSLLKLYERSARDAQHLAQMMGGKILAISRVHEITVGSEHRGLGLRDLIFAMADPTVPSLAAADALDIQGPPLMVSSRQAAPMAMILHELFINSRKYGALSVPQGRVTITWSEQGATKAGLGFRLLWSETGGPPPATTIQRGVGMELLEGLARFELAGKAEIALEPTGLRYTLDAVMDRVEAPEGASPH